MNSIDVKGWDGAVYRLIGLEYDEDIGALGVLVSYETGKFSCESLNHYDVCDSQLNAWSKE